MKLIKLTTLAFSIILCHLSFAQTTVTDGDWSDPATWGGTPPIMSGTVVINHKVTLDMDYAHNSGSITISASGELVGNSTSRNFAINFPSGTATLTVNGFYNVDASLFNSGGTAITNSGTIEADSLLNNTDLVNNSGAIINASQFMNNAGASITNDGTINTDNFLNLETVSNTGTISANDMTNAKSFNNSATGVMTIAHNFLNADTIATPAHLTMDGRLTVGNDFQNGPNPATIEGTSSGSICVAFNSLNRGTMNGTFDFCDQTGGGIDLNTGTFASGITNCLQPCTVGINEDKNLSLSFKVYPNPFSKETTIQLNQDLNKASLTVLNYFGQTVKVIENISGNTVLFSRGNLKNGLYFIRLYEDGKTIGVNKLLITD